MDLNKNIRKAKNDIFIEKPKKKELMRSPNFVLHIVLFAPILVPFYTCAFCQIKYFIKKKYIKLQLNYCNSDGMGECQIVN
jgi:hypothetical protein